MGIFFLSDKFLTSIEESLHDYVRDRSGSQNSSYMVTEIDLIDIQFHIPYDFDIGCYEITVLPTLWNPNNQIAFNFYLFISGMNFHVISLLGWS